MSRFAVIDIPDYTSEEKKIIFSKYVLPKVLKRMSLKAEECVVTEDGLDAIVELHKIQAVFVIWNRQQSISQLMPCIRLK